MGNPNESWVRRDGRWVDGGQARRPPDDTKASEPKGKPKSATSEAQRRIDEDRRRHGPTIMAGSDL